MSRLCSRSRKQLKSFSRRANRRLVSADILRNPEMAKTLRILAGGGRRFLQRRNCAAILATSQRLGGTLTREDSRRIPQNWVHPISSVYRGWQVYELPPNKALSTCPGRWTGRLDWTPCGSVIGLIRLDLPLHLRTPNAVELYMAVNRALNQPIVCCDCEGTARSGHQLLLANLRCLKMWPELLSGCRADTHVINSFSGLPAMDDRNSGRQFCEIVTCGGNARVGGGL
jgi:hypothetical protein